MYIVNCVDYFLPRCQRNKKLTSAECKIGGGLSPRASSWAYKTDCVQSCNIEILQWRRYHSWIPDSRTKQRTALKPCSWGAACKCRKSWISNVEGLANVDSGCVNECFNAILLVLRTKKCIHAAWWNSGSTVNTWFKNLFGFTKTSKYLNILLLYNFINWSMKITHVVWGAYSCFQHQP